MKPIIPVAAALLFTFCSMGSRGWSQTAEPPVDHMQITAAGSGVNLAITRLLSEAFAKDHPRIVIEVPGSIGTRGAIKAVADKAIAIGLISRPLKEEEKAMGLVAKPYARVAMIIGANPNVPDKNITSQELVEIFKGTKTRWENGKEIIVQAREKSDSGFAVLEKNIQGFREVYAESQEAKRWTLYFTDQDANQALAMTPYALGVTDFGMITTEHLRINVLKLNGIQPSPENVVNGTYPLSRELSFIYRQDNLPAEAHAFFDFVFSEAGRGILQANGYIPEK
jgi:phosphate transport system substrate-binding protein